MGSEGLQDCEMFKILHCLDNRIIGGGNVFSLTYRPRSARQNKITFLFMVVTPPHQPLISSPAYIKGGEKKNNNAFHSAFLANVCPLSMSCKLHIHFNVNNIFP